ncbi:MAG: c-type cytochrome biogenesis protein CcsB, partial [Lysinibacillus sp.]|nr:c-type cytochrome biogenesis protein CcsB [Lysinibacillus sp.]
MSLIEISDKLLFAAFIAYIFGTIFIAGSIKRNDGAQSRATKWGTIGIYISIIGFISQLGYFITRWIYSGHAPVSNMFEFTAAFGMFLVGAFILIYFMYRVTALGLVALPLAILLISYAAMFPTDVTPLVPSLQSHWLAIHVITAAIGQAILAISAVAGLVYLLKEVNPKKASRERFWLEVVLYLLVVVIGFIIVTVTFRGMGYEAQYTYIDKFDREAEIVYYMPAIFGMNESTAITEGAMDPLVDLPPMINAKKLTTVVWSFLVGTVLYLLYRLIVRRRISELLHPLVQRVNSNLVDEIGYRSV